MKINKFVSLNGKMEILIKVVYMIPLFIDILYTRSNSYVKEDRGVINLIILLSNIIPIMPFIKEKLSCLINWPSLNLAVITCDENRTQIFS